MKMAAEFSRAQGPAEREGAYVPSRGRRKSEPIRPGGEYARVPQQERCARIRALRTRPQSVQPACLRYDDNTAESAHGVCLR